MGRVPESSERAQGEGVSFTGRLLDAKTGRVLGRVDIRFVVEAPRVEPVVQREEPDVTEGGAVADGGDG